MGHARGVLGCVALLGLSIACNVTGGRVVPPEQLPPPPPPETADETQNDALAKRYAGARENGALSKAECQDFASAFGALDRSGTSRLASFNEGAVLQECGDEKGAQTVYEGLLDRDPQRWEARNNLGVLAWERGDLDAAHQLFEAATKKEPYRVPLRTNLAASERALFVKTGEARWFAQAESNLQAALAVDATSRSAYEGLAALYYERARAGDGSYALLANLVSTQGQRVLADRGEESVRLVNLDGLLAMLRDRPNAARAFFQAATKLDPSAPEPRANAAFLALRQRDVAEAKTHLLASQTGMHNTQTAESAALIGDVTLALGVVHTRAGAYAKGEREYVAVAHDPRATYNLGILYQERIAPADEGNGRGANLKAKAHFERFLDEASARRDLAEARADARHRIANIDAYVVAIDEGDRIAKQVAAMEKAERAEQAVRREQLLELERRAKDAAEQRTEGSGGS